MPRMTVRKELQMHGCDVGVSEFEDFLEATRKERYGGWTTDDLVCHPDDAKDFCDVIRRQPEYAGLPTEFILRVAMNYRKAGKQKKKK